MSAWLTKALRSLTGRIALRLKNWRHGASGYYPSQAPPCELQRPEVSRVVCRLRRGVCPVLVAKAALHDQGSALGVDSFWIRLSAPWQNRAALQVQCRSGSTGLSDNVPCLRIQDEYCHRAPRPDGKPQRHMSESVLNRWPLQHCRYETCWHPCWHE